MESPEHEFVVIGNEDVVGTDASGLLPLSPEKLNKIRKWLHPTDYLAESSEYMRHLASHVPGTGNWMQQMQHQQWMDSADEGALWIKAVPGAGKSVIAAQLVSQLHEDEGVPVLHFFFRQIVTQNRTPDSLLRDWMCQLLDFSPSLQLILNDYVDKSRNIDTIAFDELWSEMMKAMCNMPRVYCITDALDEMSFGYDSFVSQLGKLGKLKPASIKVFMTSRPVPRIEKLLKDQSVLQIILAEYIVNNDITVYVKHRLTESGLPFSVCKNIEQALMSKCQGVFLYTKLMMNDLLGSKEVNFTQKSSLEDALSRLPDGLAELYTRMLHDHSLRSGVPQKLQLTILQWVTHSSRSLRLLEIAAMLDSLPNLDADVHPLKGGRNTKAVVRRACGPLIEILEDETVSIIHHSFTEYLTDPNRAKTNKGTFPRIDPAISHRDMAITCINYLSCSGWVADFQYKSNNDGSPRAYLRDRQPPEIVATYAKYPFLRYASSYCCYHINKIEEADEELFGLLDKSWISSPKTFTSWLELRKAETGEADTTVLHVAAREGMAAYVKHLIQLGHDVNALDRAKHAPVHRAAERVTRKSYAFY